MKYLKKKKRPSPLVVVLSVIAALCLLLLLVLLMLLPGVKQAPAAPTGETGATDTQGTEAVPTTGSPEESGATDAADITEASEPTEETQPTEETTPKQTEPAKKEDFTTLKTPYGTLKYPKEWAGLLRVTIQEGNPYTLTYFADLESGKSQKLFTISFGGGLEGAIGAVTVDGKAVPVHVSTTEFKPDNSWSEKEINIVFTMQEALNPLLESIPVKTGNTPPQDNPQLPEEDGEEMTIDTPYGQLHYPTRWKDYLEVKINDKNGYSVEFRCKVEGQEPALLFTVYFGGDKGVEVGTGKDGVKIRLDVPDMNLPDTWDEEDKRIAAAMQEDVNVVLSNLP